MQSDRRLVQDVQNAGSPVAHSAGKLHSLAFAGGKRNSGAVERKISKSQVDKTFGGSLKGVAYADRHRAHFLRETVRNAAHPVYQVRKRHRAGLVEGNSAQLWVTCSLGKTRSAAVRANVLLQELFDALHALFVLDL